MIQNPAIYPKELVEQAVALENLLSLLPLRLFALEEDNPTTHMPLGQLRVCKLLEQSPRTLSGLAEELRVSASASTQIADRLERIGFVERVEIQGDRRSKLLQLTEYGRSVMHTRRQQRIRHAISVLSRLTPEARQAALCAIQVLLAAAERPEATAPPLQSCHTNAG